MSLRCRARRAAGQRRPAARPHSSKNDNPFRPASAPRDSSRAPRLRSAPAVSARRCSLGTAAVSGRRCSLGRPQPSRGGTATSADGEAAGSRGMRDAALAGPDVREHETRTRMWRPSSGGCRCSPVPSCESPPSEPAGGDRRAEDAAARRSRVANPPLPNRQVATVERSGPRRRPSAGFGPAPECSITTRPAAGRTIGAGGHRHPPPPALRPPPAAAPCAGRARRRRRRRHLSSA